MVLPAGLEPATLCLEGRCSIRLSYGSVGRMMKKRPVYERQGKIAGQPGAIKAEITCQA